MTEPTHSGGVPDAARAVIESWWQRALDISSRDHATGGILFGCAEELCAALGMPVPPHQPTPPQPEPADHVEGVGGPVCPECHDDNGYHLDDCSLDPENAAPVTEARTGPLGLSEGDRVRSKRIPKNVATFIRSDGSGVSARWLVEWDEGARDWRWADEWEPVRDAATQPAETHADEAAAAAAELDELRRWKAEAITVLNEWDRVWEAAGRPGTLGSSKAASVREWIEAASRPAPDNITVNRDDLRRVLDWIGRMDGQDAPYMSVLRLSRALAAAGLPQEPTGDGDRIEAAARLLAPQRPEGVPDTAALMALADRLDELACEHPDEHTIVVDLASIAEWRDRIRTALLGVS